MGDTALNTTDLAGLMKSARVAGGLSQMALALRLGVSQRHVNFIERGRSRPSRVLLLDWLANTERPPSMYNAALRLAGFAAMDDADPVRPCDAGCDEAALRLLALHAPNPAFAFDADWHLVRSNAAGRWLMARVMPRFLPSRPDGPTDLIEVLASPDGWLARSRAPAEVGATLLKQLRAEQWARPSLGPRVDALEGALRAAHGELPPVSRAASTPLVDVTFDTAVGPLAFSVAQAWSGLPLDQDHATVRAELWYPADGPTAAALRSAAALQSAP